MSGALKAQVIVASNRATAGVYADTSGPILVDGLRQRGFDVPDPIVVADGEPVKTAILAAIQAKINLVVTSGGTGITPTDRTPDVTRNLIDYEVPGIAEAIRAHSRDTVPTAALSRGIAGVKDSTLIVNLPGSPGGARDGLAVLGPIVVHAVEQLAGGDHPQPTV